MNEESAFQLSTYKLFAMLFHRHPDNTWNNNAHLSIATPYFTFKSSNVHLFSLETVEYFAYFSNIDLPLSGVRH